MSNGDHLMGLAGVAKFNGLGFPGENINHIFGMINLWNIFDKKQTIANGTSLIMPRCSF
jgi:hypothetical protein